MPRLINTGVAVTEHCEETGDKPTTFDLCSKCALYYQGQWVEDIENIDTGDRICYLYSEPEGYLDGNAPHPKYKKGDTCVICNKQLSQRVDG